ALLGVGAGGMATAGVLGAVTLAKVHTAQSSAACMNPSGNEAIAACNGLRDAARGFQTAGIVAVAAGGALAATGVALVVTSPRAAQVSIELHPTGVMVLGRY